MATADIPNLRDGNRWKAGSSAVNRAILLTTLIWIGRVTLAQTGLGSITGTVNDPSGARVENAVVKATSTTSGWKANAKSTSTGNYWVPEVPYGAYDVSVSAPGFKDYVRKNVLVGVGQIVRVDVPLELGVSSETVSVAAPPPLLNTETGDVSYNVSVQALDQVPMLSIGTAAAGSSGIRNPNNVLWIVPGTYYAPNSNVKLNGAPTNSQAYSVEGMDATNQGFPYSPAGTQPGVDAIEEVSVKTSNFAPEFGSGGGGFFNVTMRSGTNSFHGSAYDYFVNEALNSATPFTGYPFTSTVPGTPHVKPRARRNDYGLTGGGPVRIPGIYNGRDSTFFFATFEQFRETQIINNIPATVPTAAYRTGDFNGAIAAAGNQVLGSDPLGRPILQNEIYDPNTARTVNGELIADPFPDNTIPASRLDPVALKIQNLLPLPNLPGSVNNFLPSYFDKRVTTIPSIKIDQRTGDKGQLSFYWSMTRTDAPYDPLYGGAEGFPSPITEDQETHVYSHIERLNYNYTISPTLLLHAGVGYQHLFFNNDAPDVNYNAAQELGLTGATLNRNFPQITGLCPAVPFGVPQCSTSSAGGSNNLGPYGQNHFTYSKPGENASATWVRGSHTYKIGWELYYLRQNVVPYMNANGSYSFGPNETGLPYLVAQGNRLNGGATGFAYASFLLGAVDSVTIAAPAQYQNNKYQLAFFWQDSWKTTRKLTLDYGLRWDYGTYFRESEGRTMTFSPTTPNPSVGNIPGGFIFEGDGPGRCNCSFAKNYPYSFGPRFGAAYQLTRRTVLRGGWGLLYNQTGTYNLGVAAAGTATSNTVSSPGPGTPAMYLQNGIPAAYIPSWPVYSAGLFPTNPSGGQALPSGIGLFDSNAARPARQDQWNLGIQQEILPNLAIEAAWVGNHGVWWPSAQSEDYNALTPQILAAHGLSLMNAADIQLLASPLSSATAVARGFQTPYPGFSAANTVAQSLRPFPQFGNIPLIGAPLGETWYNALQVRVLERASHGLFLTAEFTWQKSLESGVDNNPNTAVAGVNYVGAVGNQKLAKSFSSFDQPFVLDIAATYTTSKIRGNRVLSWLLRDWQIGALVQYASGLPIPSPAATTTPSLSTLIFQPSLADRVPGVPLYTENINCHCFDPATTFVLNPAAWTNPPAGQFGTAAPYYDDFRYARHPIENGNIGRTFRFSEKYSLQLRVEFTNILNRTYLNNPSAGNPFAPQTRYSTGPLAGLAASGFGAINLATNSTQFGQPRQGVIVARFQF